MFAFKFEVSIALYFGSLRVRIPLAKSMKLYQLSELDFHIMFRGEWLKYLGIPIWNISEALYRQRSFHVDLQSGEQIQQFCFLNAFVWLWKGSQEVPLNQDVRRKSKQRLCALYSQVVKCWQLSRVHCLKVMWALKKFASRWFGEDLEITDVQTFCQLVAFSWKLC